ncbi:hypothetical protein [Paenibacillus pini]
MTVAQIWSQFIEMDKNGVKILITEDGWDILIPTIHEAEQYNFKKSEENQAV